jgi:hypothetical protein
MLWLFFQAWRARAHAAQCEHHPVVSCSSSGLSPLRQNTTNMRSRDWGTAENMELADTTLCEYPRSPSPPVHFDASTTFSTMMAE